MNRLRYALIAGICVVCYLLFLQWNEFEARQNAARQSIEAAETTVVSGDIPDTLATEGASSANTVVPTAVPNTMVPNVVSTQSEDLPSINDSGVAPTQVNAPASTTQRLIDVTTDKFHLLIDSFGGDIVRVELPEHLANREESGGFVLMNRSANSTYVAQSGLIGSNGTDKSGSNRPLYQTRFSEYSLKEGEDTLVIDLLTQQEAVTITKRFTFERDSYLIKIDYIVQNDGDALWRAAPYGQIRRGDFEVKSDVGIGMQPYLGAAITTNDKNYDKVSFGDIEDKTMNITKTGGWVSMVQHYFISAWVPDQDVKNSYTLKKAGNQDLYILEYVGPISSVEPNSQAVIESAFYAGPKNLKKLEAISPYLDLTLDYSWLSFIAKPLFLALDFIHSFVGNWGVAIILLTVLIKLVFFYPSAVSYRSMAKMRKLQPMMADLKERYGDDRQKMSGELMKVYKKEKINPLSGCLPILMQMPVFIALYWVLMESVELRHAPFALWIQDLSIKDPFFLLPLIMGATMWIQQKLNPTPPDPMQAKIMQWMPVFFTFLFLMFPAGLVLYWVVNNTLSIAQQYIITRQIEKGDA